VRFGFGFRFIAGDFRGEKNPNFLLGFDGSTETNINDDDKSRRAHNCRMYRAVDKSDHGSKSSSRHPMWHIVAKTSTISPEIRSNPI